MECSVYAKRYKYNIYTGSFEVHINDTLIHSKLASMAFPKYEDVAENVKMVSEGHTPKKCQEQPITDCVLQ